MEAMYARIVCLLKEPMNATVNEIVTRLLATTGVLIKYSRGEEIRNTNRAQTRVVATRRWRRTGSLEIFIFIFIAPPQNGDVSSSASATRSLASAHFPRFGPHCPFW